MNSLSTRIFVTAIIGLGLTWLVWDALGTPLRPGDGIVMVTFVVCLCWNLFLAGTMERQLYWLSKGHARQRATEVLVPPKGLRQLSNILNAKTMTEEEARGALIRLDTYIKHYLLTAARLTPSLVILAGLSCSLTALVGTHVSLTKGEALPQISTEWLMAGLLSYGVMGLILGASLWAGTTQLRSIAENTLKKAGQLIQQTGALPQAPAVRRYPTPALVWIGALFPLALIPVAGIQSYNLYTLIVEKGKVVSLSETKTNLQQNVEELKTKLDENTKDSDQLAADLRAEKATIQKLEAELAKQKKAFTSLSADKKKTDAALKTSEDKVADMGKKIDATEKELKKAQSDAADTAKKLAAVQKEKDKLAADLKETESTLAKTKSAAATHEAELEQKITNLEDDTDRLKEQLKEARDDVTKARKQRDDIIKKVQIAKPDTKNMHPAIKALPDGKLVVSADVLFNGKSTDMSDISESILNDIANRMSSIMGKSNPDAVLVIGVHTDIVPPSGGDNMSLTASQASRIADVFAAQGLTRRRLVPIGFGQHQEVDARLTEDAFAANRRVEFYVLPQLVTDITVVDK
ncbi:MAG: OmpA family protein [Proteobacteria bacterium]|nr:OmpA family protein [Pseudomonadota bacterium]